MRKPDGLLFIGDPHVTAAKPSRRLDEDFLATSLGKLGKALALAKELNLAPVITGDLVNKPYERAVLHSLIAILIDVRPYCLIGNHEGSGDDTTMVILLACRAIRPVTMDEPLTIELSGGKVRLFGVNHGKPIPTSLPIVDGTINILLTHHNLEFSKDKSYPGMILPPAVANCPLAVNGHVHHNFAPLIKGDTIWHNPGNILRMSIDTKEHTPAVLAMNLEAGKPVTRMIPLQGVQPHVFEMELSTDFLATMPAVPSSSHFAMALASTAGLDRPQSDDGDELAIALKEVMNADEFSMPVKNILADLYREVTTEMEP